MMKTREIVDVLAVNLMILGSNVIFAIVSFVVQNAQDNKNLSTGVVTNYALYKGLILVSSAHMLLNNLSRFSYIVSK